MKAPLPFLLAIGIGLGSGLALSRPLAALLRAPAPGETLQGPALRNPFASWIESAGEELLVLGTDQGGGNTDVITLVRVEGGVTRVTQIPRDSYIETERWGPIKVNSLYSLGGEDAVKRELSQRMGKPIRHHVIVNLSAMRHLADLVGGLEVDVPKRLYYVDNSQGLMIDLQPGPQLLKGRQLEGFLRFRHDEEGDIGRLQRQELALQALFRKLAEPASMVRLPSLLIATRQEISTNLGPMELGGLITAMGASKLQTTRLEGRPFDRNGVNYLEINWPVQEETTIRSESGERVSTVDEQTSPLLPDPQRYRSLY